LLCRQSTALFVSKPESATAKLLAQHLVLLAQILYRLLLLLIHPARNRDQQNRNGSRTVSSAVLQKTAIAFSSARSSFWTKRGCDIAGI